MIFVTIGSMFPFDRLIQAMDQWTAATGHGDVFAQTGNGAYVPQHMKHVRTLPQAEFTATVMLQGMVTDRLSADGYILLTNEVVAGEIAAESTKLLRQGKLLKPGFQSPATAFNHRELIQAFHDLGFTSAPPAPGTI